MFEAIQCVSVNFPADGVHTLFYYRPDGIPATFDSWGTFRTINDVETRICVELGSDTEDTGRYSVVNCYAGGRPHITDRTDLLR